MESDNQTNNKPWLWKKGQSGNPKGRPKGKTMKEWAKDYLMTLDEDERENFLDGLPKEIVWRMAEGNPATNSDITSGGKPIIMLTPEIAAKNALNAPDTSPE